MPLRALENDILQFYIESNAVESNTTQQEIELLPLLGLFVTLTLYV